MSWMQRLERVFHSTSTSNTVARVAVRCVSSRASRRPNSSRRSSPISPRATPTASPAVGDSDDKIIAVAHQHRLASKARLHLALEPHVQCVVQVQVPQQRRESRTLRNSPLGLCPLLSVQHAYANTLPDQPPQRPVGDPNPEHLLEPGAIQTVEEGLDVSLQNPAHLALVHRTVQRTNRIVGAASGPKAIRALQKVLLVHRLPSDSVATALLGAMAGGR